jgi:hypothetical protein
MAVGGGFVGSGGTGVTVATGGDVAWTVGLAAGTVGDPAGVTEGAAVAGVGLTGTAVGEPAGVSLTVTSGVTLGTSTVGGGWVVSG